MYKEKTYKSGLNFFKLILSMILLILLSNNFLFGQTTFTSAQSGAWNNDATWAGPGRPGAGDHAVISSGHTVTLAPSNEIINLTIEAGGVIDANGRNMIVNGNLTVNGDYDFNSNNDRYIDLRGANAIIDGSGIILNSNNGVVRVVIPSNKTIASTANLTLGDKVNIDNIADNVTVLNNGSISVAGNIVGNNATTSRWEQGNGAYLRCGGALLNTGTLIANTTNNTIEYSGAAGQTIKTPSANTYYNLVLSGSSVKTMAASLTIDGNLNINGATLQPGANNRDITIRGNWQNSGTFNPTPFQQRVIFDGTANQSITNSLGETFYRLTVNKSSGTLLLNNNVLINGATGTFDLNMTAGNINAQGNTLSLGSAAGGPGTLNHTSGQVIGKFGRWINATGTNFTYPVGAVTNYRPAVFNAAAGLTNGYIIIEHIASAPPPLFPVPLTDVNEDYNMLYNDGYWSVTTSGAVCTNFNLSLTGGGFTSFAIENGPTHFTRILKHVSGSWQAGASSCSNNIPGCPNGVAGNTVSRNLISGLAGVYAFATRYYCVGPTMPVVSGTLDVCSNESNVSYSSTGGATSNFTWSLPGGGGSIDAPASGVGVQNVTVDWGSAGGTYVLQVVENNGCTDSDPGLYNVNVHPLPTSVISGNNYVNAYSSGETYTVTSTPGYTYTWTVVSGNITGGQGSSSITVEWLASGIGTVSVVATPSFGCVDAPAVQMTVAIIEVYYSNGNGGGDWHVPATWQCNCVPTALSSIRILNGDVVRLNNNKTINNVIVDYGGKLDADKRDITINGDFIVNGVYDFNVNGSDQNINLAGTNSVFGGTGIIRNTGTSTANSINITGSKTIPVSANLTVEEKINVSIGDNVTVTNNGVISVAGNINGATINSRWVQSADAQLYAGGALLLVGVLEAGAQNNIITYNGTIAQTIKVPSASLYYHLTLTGSSVKTMAGSILLDGNLIIDGTTLQPGANDRDISVAGNWQNNGIFNPTPFQQRVTFNGAANQTISNTSGETFYRLSVNKSGGTLMLNNNVTVNGTAGTFDLTMTAGNINTQGHILYLGSTTGGPGTINHTSGSVVGKFARWINATGTGFVFPVGTYTHYRPATFNAAAGLTNGYVIVEHIASNPGALSPIPFTDVGEDYNMTYNDGYWQLGTQGATACTNFNLSLTGGGFTSFDIENGPTHFTRVLKRTAGTWLAGAASCVNDAAGCPNGVAGNVVSRNLVNGIAGDYAFATRYVCTPPATPVISGPLNVCKNQLDVAYSSTGDAASHFTWTLPLGGGTIDIPPSGVGVQSITVDWGNTGSSFILNLVENNGCTNSDLAEVTVNVHPYPTSSITGSAQVTEYADGEVYSIVTDLGYSYTWTVTGGSIISGQGTGSIVVNWGAAGVSANVSVVATPPAGCQTAPAVNFPVSIFEAYQTNGTGGGAWNNTATWECNCIPAPNNSIRILNGDAVNLNLDQSIKNMTIDYGGTLDADGRSFEVSGNIIVNGVYDFNKGAAATRTLTLSGSNANIGGTGVIRNSQAAADCRISITDSKIIIPSADLTVEARVDINNIAANVTVTNNGKISVVGNIIGTNATSRWVQGSNSRLSVGGTLLTAGTLEAVATGNTVNYFGTAAQTTKVPVSTYYNLEVSSTNTVTLGGHTTVSNVFNVISGTAQLAGFNIAVQDSMIVSGILSDNNNAGANSFGFFTINNGGLVTTSVTSTYSVARNLTMYGGAITSTANTPTWNVAGDFNVPSGNATVGGGTIILNVSSTTRLDGSLNFTSTAGNKTLNDLVINFSGTFQANTGATPFVINGNMFNDGAFTSTTPTYNLAGNTKNINGSSGFAFGTGFVTVNGSYFNNTTILVPNLTIIGSLTNRDIANVTTTFDGSGSYINDAGSTLNVSAQNILTTIFNPSAGCNLVNYNRHATDQTIRAATYCDLQVSTTGGAKAIFSTTGATSVTNDFTVTNTGIAEHIGAVDLTVSGLTDITGTLNFTTATTGVRLFNDVTVNSSGIWSNTSNTAISISGNIQHDGATFLSGTGIYSLTGAAKNINGSSPLSISNVNVAGSYTNNYAILNGCTLSTNGYSLAGVGTLSQAVDAVLYIGGNATLATLNATANPNTVYYALGQLNQSIKTTTYHHLEIAKSAGTANLAGTIQVNGDITISNGTLSDNGANDINLFGNWLRSGAGIFSPSTGKVVFRGANSQTVTGVTTFSNVTIDKNNLSQTVTLNNNITINDVLRFNLGQILTGVNYCIISSTGSVNNAGQSSGWVNGYLQKNIATGNPVNRNYEVGGTSVYAPVSVTFNSVSVAGNFVVRTVDGDHPDLASSNIIVSQSLNRYYTLINESATFTSFDAIANFNNPSDLDPGVVPTSTEFLGKRFDGFDWVDVGIGVRNASNTEITGESFAAYPSGESRYLALGYAIITIDVYTRVIGGGHLWSNPATWIQTRNGSITYANGSTVVSGSGTDFSNQLDVGDVIICQASPQVEIGTVAAIDPVLQTLTLAAPASASGSCNFGRQRVPGTNDQIVYIGNPYINDGVEVIFDPVSTIINQLAFYRHPAPISNTLTHNPGTTLNLQVSVHVNQPDANGQIYAWNINDGTVEVNGSLTIGSNDPTTSRVANVRLGSGIVNIGTGLRFRSPAASDLPTVLDMSAGSGIVSVGSVVVLENGSGTINGGGWASGSIFRYNGSLGQQAVTFGGDIRYNNLHLSNTHVNGVVLADNITTTNVTGNVVIEEGFFANAGYAINGNAVATFEAMNDATFRMTGTASFPTNFGSYVFDPTSLVQYYQTNAQIISPQTYGHLHVEPAANTITHTFPAASVNVMGDLQVGNGINTGVVVNGSGAGTHINVRGNLSIRENTLFSNSLIPSIECGGNWTQNGTYLSANNDLITFNGTANQLITCASAVTFPHLTVDKPSATALSVNGFNDLTTNNLTISSGGFTAPATLNINRAGNSSLTNSGRLTAGTVINITGNWTKNTGASFNENTSTVNFTGALPQTIGGTALADTFYNVVISKSLATDIVNTGGSINTLTTNDLTISTGTFTAPTTLNIERHMLLATGQTLIAGNAINVKGNWTNNTGTFTHGTSNVTFNGVAGQQINGTAPTQTFYNLIVNKALGSTLNAGGNTTTLNINSVTLNSGIFAIGTASTINVALNWTNNGGTFNGGTGTVFFTGTAAQQINGTAGSETFNNVTLDKTAGTLLNSGGSIVTINVNNLTQNTGNLTGPNTLNINGNYLLAAGQTFTAGININIQGNWTNNSGTFVPGTGTVVFNGSAAQQINGTLAAQTFYNFHVNKSAGGLTVGGSTVTLNAAFYTNFSGSFTAPATFNITNNVLLNDGTFTAGTNTNVGGNWTNNGAAFAPGTNKVTFNGTGANFINGSTATQVFFNVDKTGTGSLTTGGGLSTLTFNQYVQSAGNFNAASLTTLNINSIINHTAGIFTAPAGTLVKGGGNWTNSATFVHNNGTVRFNSSLALVGTSIYNLNNVIVSGGVTTAPAANMNIAGNFTNNSSYLHNNGRVTLNGSNQQNIGGISTTTFYNLTVNNSYVPTAVHLNASINTNNNLTLTNGHIVTSMTNILTMGPVATFTLNGTPQENSYIKGPMRHTVNVGASVTKVFPIGKNISYRRMELTIDQSMAASKTYTAELFVNDGNVGCTNYPPTIDYVSRVHYYEISQSVPPLALDNAQIRVYFGCQGHNDEVTDLPNLVVAKSNCPDQWIDLGGTTSAALCDVINYAGYVDSDINFTSFSRFAIANVLGGGNPLPIELLSFNAVPEDENVRLVWTTATETNNDFFTIERSLNALDVEVVDFVAGAGNSSTPLSYSAYDYKPFNGISYYRLKQTDFDGQFSYSDWVPVEFRKFELYETQVMVYPNPFNNILNLHFVNFYDKNVQLNFYDVLGKPVVSKTFSGLGESHFNKFSFDMSHLPTGIYFLRIESDNFSHFEKVVLQK